MLGKYTAVPSFSATLLRNSAAQSSPNDDLTDDPMDLVVYHVSRVLSFTVQLVVL